MGSLRSSVVVALALAAASAHARPSAQPARPAAGSAAAGAQAGQAVQAVAQPPAVSAGAERSYSDRQLQERAQLREALDAVLRRHPLQDARVGVHVVSLETGEVVYTHDADELLNPASNVKLFTAATALARLGPEYRFSTEFSCVEAVQKGECRTLYIKGRGDPSLYTERIYGIAGELLHRGLHKVGDIVVDDTYFDSEREGPGWEQEHTDKPYMAPAGALSINHNAVAVFVSPGEGDKGKPHVELEPASDYFVVENKVAGAGKKSRQRLVTKSIAAGERQRIVVEGRLPAGRETSVFYKKIDNPPMYAGETFKAVFKERGIQVKGKVRLGTVPADAVALFTSKSDALPEIVRELNKVSNNFVAEQLLKTVGAEVMGPPGTWSKGVAAAEEFLGEIGIPKGSYVMKNGSGLNDTNRFSTAQITRLLAAVHQKSLFYPEYASSLGIAGRDGTIRNRMEGTAAEGRLRGKTGTLENVTALSGYVQLANGELLAYSILVNDFTTRHGPAVAAVDAIASALASGGVSDGEEPSAVAKVDGVAMPGELRARVATFSALGKMADKRNLPFLRSALRVEKDPVLRAVLADAIYRTDPESGAQGLLDNVPAAPETFAKLRALGQELSLPTPFVSSLIDVAADGNGDALDRLIQLAHQAKDDEATASVLSDGFQEIGRTAPDELADALKRAPADVVAESLQLLGRGIAQSEERQSHPFMERLKNPGDAKKTASAMALYEKLHKVLDQRPGEAKVQPAAAEQKAEPKPANNGGVSLPGGG